MHKGTSKQSNAEFSQIIQVPIFNWVEWKLIGIVIGHGYKSERSTVDCNSFYRCYLNNFSFKNHLQSKHCLQFTKHTTKFFFFKKFSCKINWFFNEKDSMNLIANVRAFPNLNWNQSSLNETTINIKYEGWKNVLNSHLWLNPPTSNWNFIKMGWILLCICEMRCDEFNALTSSIC